VENLIKSYIILSDFHINSHHIDYCIIHQCNKYQPFNLTSILMKFDKKLLK